MSVSVEHLSGIVKASLLRLPQIHVLAQIRAIVEVVLYVLTHWRVILLSIPFHQDVLHAERVQKTESSTNYLQTANADKNNLKNGLS